MEKNNEEDTLQEIPDDDLPLLKKLYEHHQLEAPHVYNLLQIYVEWKQKKKHNSDLRFYGLDNDWLKSGTFILLFEYSMYDLFFYTLEENYDKLHHALTKTHRINWEKRIIWFSLSSKYTSTLLRILKQIKSPRRELLYGSLWSLEKEEALKFDLECPDEVYMQELNRLHAPTVDIHWTYRSEGTEDYIGKLIEMNISYGLFLKSSDSLVCWVLLNEYGMISNLQTLPGYERKGLVRIDRDPSRPYLFTLCVLSKLDCADLRKVNFGYKSTPDHYVASLARISAGRISGIVAVVSADVVAYALAIATPFAPINFRDSLTLSTPARVQHRRFDCALVDCSHRPSA
ncbi:hypothetical protein Trydic_g5381 [Trypoxylus dichotomus]